jgi:hypothetical protein
MSKTIVIGCRLPSGLVLDLPRPDGTTAKVVLNGQNSTQARSPVILLSTDDYGVTDVDQDFWDAWKLAYAGFEPLVKQIIFEAKSMNDAKAIHAEVKDELTGVEPMPQTVPSIQPEA